MTLEIEHIRPIADGGTDEEEIFNQISNGGNGMLPFKDQLSEEKKSAKCQDSSNTI